MRSQLVEERQLVWHAAELPGAVGCARQRNLHVVETTGEAVTVVQFDTQWRRESGFNHRDQQWFLLEGSLKVGDRDVIAPAYLSLPGGALIEAMVVAAGSRAVVCRESSWFFEETSWMQPWATAQCEIRDASSFESTAIVTLRETSTSQTLLVSASTAELARWPHGAHSAILLEGRFDIAPAPLLAPIGTFGDLSSAYIPTEGARASSHRWLVLTRTSSHEDAAESGIDNPVDVSIASSPRSSDRNHGKAE